MSDKLTLVVEPLLYFRELVQKALVHQKITAGSEIEFYLVNLLNHFMYVDRLYQRSPEGPVRDESLVQLVKKAFEEPQVKVQAELFRHIGDVTLYIAGFFQDSLNRKLVDVDYYIDMGGSAYQQVSSRMEEKMDKFLYKELAEKFGDFVEVLAEVSDQTQKRSEKDLLRTYEIWLRTRSDRAAKALQQAGIIPNKTIKRDWH